MSYEVPEYHTDDGRSRSRAPRRSDRTNLDTYLRDIAEMPLLSPSQEVALTRLRDLARTLMEDRLTGVLDAAWARHLTAERILAAAPGDPFLRAARRLEEAVLTEFGREQGAAGAMPAPSAVDALRSLVGRATRKAPRHGDGGEGGLLGTLSVADCREHPLQTVVHTCVGALRHIRGLQQKLCTSRGDVAHVQRSACWRRRGRSSASPLSEPRATPSCSGSPPPPRENCGTPSPPTRTRARTRRMRCAGARWIASTCGRRGSCWSAPTSSSWSGSRGGSRGRGCRSTIASRRGTSACCGAWRGSTPGRTHAWPPTPGTGLRTRSRLPSITTGGRCAPPRHALDLLRRYRKACRGLCEAGSGGVADVDRVCGLLNLTAHGRALLLDVLRPCASMDRRADSGAPEAGTTVAEIVPDRAHDDPEGRSDDLHRLREALTALDARERAVLHMRYGLEEGAGVPQARIGEPSAAPDEGGAGPDRLTHQEIGRRLGVSRRTVYAIQTRALGKLARLLGG